MTSEVEQLTEPSQPETWKDLLEDILPPQGCWSDEEYLTLTEHRNRLIEFTDGYLDVLPWPTCSHQRMLGYLLKEFSSFFDPRVLRPEFSVSVDEVFDSAKIKGPGSP